MGNPRVGIIGNVYGDEDEQKNQYNLGGKSILISIFHHTVNSVQGGVDGD